MVPRAPRGPPGGKSIQQWINYCEGLCTKSKAMISNSGCIEALDAFNRSEDGSLDVTPPPFDRPSVDDSGNVSGADPSRCGLAPGQQRGAEAGHRQGSRALSASRLA